MKNLNYSFGAAIKTGVYFRCQGSASSAPLRVCIQFRGLRQGMFGFLKRNNKSYVFIDAICVGPTAAAAHQTDAGYVVLVTLCFQSSWERACVVFLRLYRLYTHIIHPRATQKQTPALYTLRAKKHEESKLLRSLYILRFLFLFSVIKISFYLQSTARQIFRPRIMDTQN